MLEAFAVSEAPTVSEFFDVPGEFIVASCSRPPKFPAATTARKSGFSHDIASTPAERVKLAHLKVCASWLQKR